MLTILLLCLFILGVDDQRCLELTMEGKIIRPQMISTGRRWIAFGGKHLYYPNSLSTFRLLKLSGDIELNPGPSRPPTGRNQRWKYPCGECLKPVKNNQNGVLCASCSQWFHVKCIGMSLSMFNSFYLVHTEEEWTCTACALPSLSDSFFENVDPAIGFGDLSTSIDHDINVPLVTFLAEENIRHNNTEMVIHFNCRSLLPKVDELHAVFESSKPLFIATTETWLNNSITNME